MSTLRWLSPSSEGVSLDLLDQPSTAFKREWNLLCEATNVPSTGVIAWADLLVLLESKDVSIRDVTETVLQSARLGQPVKPALTLRCDGTLTDSYFRLLPELTLKTGERVRLNRLQGAVYPSHTQGDVILSLDAWRIIEAARAPTPASDSERYLAWGRLKTICERYGVTLEGYLAETDVATVEEIQPQPHWEGDQLTFMPSSLEVNADELNQALRTRYGVRPVVSTVTPGGGRRRIVMSPKAQQGAIQVLAQPPLKGDEALKALDNPGRLFDPSIFDLTHLGDRVMGIGPPRYRAVLNERNSSNLKWLSDDYELGELFLELSDLAQPELPPLRIDLSNDEARSPIEAEIASALQEQRRYARITDPQSGQQLNVLATHDIHAALKDYGQTLSKPQPEDAVDLTGHVLEIYDNLETADHVVVDAVHHVPNSFQPNLSSLLAEHLKLYPYQVTGHRVLRWWLDHKAKGGLLADDMGLGKTLQVITIIAWLAQHNRLKPTLIVAPTSLLDNWEAELYKFAPDARLSIGRLLGTPKGQEARLANHDIVLTSYESLARRDIEMALIHWRLLICDEAQKIKNPSTRMTNTVKAMNADARIAITGTPIENRLAELWCIMDFAIPGLLGSLSTFNQRFASKSILNDEQSRFEAADELRATIAPMFLRRMKHQVLNESLPPLSRTSQIVGLSSLQRSIYARVKARAQNGGSGAMLSSLTHLLQLCAHPFVLYPEGKKTLDPIEVCPKLAQTIKWLDQIRERGEKALVFARWNSVQQILADVFEDRYRLPNVQVLNSTIPPNRRQSIINAFQTRSGFDVMILAPRACGVGLNITSANHVIHYTREWNPAIESQATDRVYRIGQERPVSVYYPLVSHPTWDSVEIVLDELIQSKEALQDDFMQPISPIDKGLLADRLAQQQTIDRDADLTLGIEPVEILHVMVQSAQQIVEHPLVGDQLWAYHNGQRWWAVTNLDKVQDIQQELDRIVPRGQGELALLNPLGRFTRRGPLKQRATLIEGRDLAPFLQMVQNASYASCKSPI